MTTAREIADTRLARGEITVEEHAGLLARLAPPPIPQAAPVPPPLPPQHFAQAPQAPSYIPPQVGQPTPPTSPYVLPPEQQKSSGPKWAIAGAAVVGLLVLFGAFINSTVGGLQIGNLSERNRLISFKLANDSHHAEDVLLFVEQNGMRMCERIVSVRARMNYDISMECPTLGSGRFVLTPMWASADRQMAMVATRIQHRN